MKKIKFIFCDMDGTLLDEAGNLPKDFDEVMAEIKSRGAIFAPSSGRQYAALVTQMKKYKNDFLFLSENGAYSAYQGRELFADTVPNQFVQMILEKGKNFFPVLCGKNIAYVAKEWIPHLKHATQFFTQCEVVNDFEDLKKIANEQPIIKVAFCDVLAADAEKNIYRIMKQIENDCLQVILASNYWVDVMRRGINKGVAVQRVQKLFHASPEECMAFGDYLNDHEMLAAVKFGYAMENAHEGLKASAKFFAPSNTENGVMKVLREYLREGKI